MSTLLRPMTSRRAALLNLFVVLFEPMNSRDVRAVERSELLGFALEPSQTLGVVREVLWDNLEATSRPSFVSRAR